MNIFYRSGCLLLCLELSGCAGMHMYSEKRDQQGKELKAAWARVDRTGIFTTMNEPGKQLDKAGMAAIGGARDTRVDSAMMLLLDARIGGGGAGQGSFYGVLDGELDQFGNKLGAAGREKVVDGWLSLSLRLQANRVKQDSYRKLIRAEGAAAPACPVEKKAGGVEPDGYAAEYLVVLAALCGAEAGLIRDQKETIAGLPSGSLRKSGDDAAKLEQEYAEAGSQADRLMAQYRQALDKYAAAAGASQSGAAPSLELAEAGAKVRAVLALMAATNNILGNEAAANDRVKRIDAILAKLGTSKEAGGEASGAELAAVLVTRVADDAQVLAELHKPPVPASLLIRLDLEKNRADLARVQADLFRKDIELVRDIQASKVAEAFQLLVARGRLDELKPCYRRMSFLDAVAFPVAKTIPRCDDPDSRAALYDAAGRYLYAIGDQRANTQRLEQRRRDLQRERQLAYGRANVEQWAALIDATAGQAVAYAASGQKVSDYKDVIQALSLLWIGQGVNK
ncbi:MAG: hypothetical protein V4484_24110 [Pseudomonadota bacterium]